jgi:hypothetical protein
MMAHPEICFIPWLSVILAGNSVILFVLIASLILRVHQRAFGFGIVTLTVALMDGMAFVVSDNLVWLMIAAPLVIAALLLFIPTQRS